MAVPCHGKHMHAVPARGKTKMNPLQDLLSWLGRAALHAEESFQGTAAHAFSLPSMRWLSAVLTMQADHLAIGAAYTSSIVAE